MGQCIPIGSGIICLVETDFNCPNCEYRYEAKDYETRLFNSKRGVIYKTCKGCGRKMGITTDIQGDVRVWLKENETKLK